MLDPTASAHMMTMFMVITTMAMIAFAPRHALEAAADSLAEWFRPAEPERKPWHDHIMLKNDMPAENPLVGIAALKTAETGEAWLQFSKESFAQSQERQKGIDALTTKVGEKQLEVMNEQQDWAKKDRDFYEKTFQPLMEKYATEAANYNTPAKQAEAAAEAKADIQTQAASERATAGRQAASLGINPASGRGQAIARSQELGTALASAGAQNTARENVRKMGLALTGDAINVGRGLPAQSAVSTQLGLGAGSSALAGASGANQQFLASTGIMGQGFAGAQTGYAQQASILNQQYQNQLQAYQLKQQDSAGIGQAIGSIVGLGLSISSKTKKTDKKPVEDGKALDAVKKMPVEQWTYKKGVADEGTHIGPYAEDMKAETGLGDGKTIAFQDAIGITMKAVQDLDAKVTKISKAIGLGDTARAPARRATPETKAPAKKAA